MPYIDPRQANRFVSMILRIGNAGLARAGSAAKTFDNRDLHSCAGEGVHI
jgi:hypothetical protein